MSLPNRWVVRILSRPGLNNRAEHLSDNIIGSRYDGYVIS
jgi:hypothetical protein